MKKGKVLIVAAHPDDEILGCGGTIARFAGEGCEVYTLILGEGVTSRDKKRKPAKRKKEIDELKKQTRRANKIVGVKKVFFHDFPDNRFDTVPFLDIVKRIEEVKRVVMPDAVFTHYENDLNIDHRLTSRAVITATRPVAGESVREIYSFEGISSTEWKYPVSFSPDVFFDISGAMGVKLKALERYTSELREYPHPRSLESVELVARTWGMKVGLRHAEAFKSIRCIK